ncbi:acyl-CoA dehydrogenase [Actinoallomurus bryophytorum]|uniref:Alkylation response protein AidB-like acyl-CoA dehydrogenase n=1 Tax=Actinoallomurus bryophytorum TaxID=1490222 RepID=A0A543CHB3_9ACTN|nr:acyl-CoA dehydrogenase family protein [Actinoallomurus bryophytorum]TQL96493.1 alkylation response protein AidB-like acyl-CoA dehydrogenase [Actinoallomurus bryophytorum]
MTTETIENDQARTLLASAEETERHNRPTAENLEVVRRHGAFALRTPERFGGAWANATTVAGRLAELGRYCPSTAWIAGTCLTAKTFAAEAFGDAVPRDLFADPDALACGSGIPSGSGERTPDGVRVNGRWPYVSGCEDATWAGLAVLIDGTYTYAVIPTAELTVERTWRVAGMRGTGSHTLVARDVLVPAGLTAAVRPPVPATLVFYGIAVLAPVAGAARGALDVTNAMFASDRKPSMTAYARMGDSPAARQWLAEATLLVDRADRTMFAAARAVDAAGVTGADSARLHLDLADAAQDCRSAVELMLDLHGASGFAAANPLQRYWRDIAVGSRHAHLRPYMAVENYGQALAGQA